MYPSVDQLIALGASPRDAERVAEPLAETCIHYQITTPLRLAAFLAQVFHESGRLRYLREIWGPTVEQNRYWTKNGNTNPADGKKYLGRGLIQTTGKDNYRKARDYLRRDVPDVPDFVARPELLEDPQWAALSAGAYWDRKGLNALADAGEFDEITQVVNGGQNGRDDRRALYAKARRIFV